MNNLHPIFQMIIDQHMPDLEKYKVPFEYKGYTIDLDKEADETRYLFYPSSHREPKHDYDYIGEQYVYRGNCKFRDTIGDCMHEIDQAQKPTEARLHSLHINYFRFFFEMKISIP